MIRSEAGRIGINVSPAADARAGGGGRFPSSVPRAIAWTTLLRVLTRGLGVVTTLVLARLIAPEEYGVFAAILIAYTGLRAFTETSVRPALTQLPDDPAPYLDTAWTVDVARGVALFAVVFVVAPIWCGIFGVPQAVPMLRVLGAAHLATGLHNIGTATFSRDFRFGRLFALHASENVTYSVAAIALGIAWHSAWALVWAIVLSFVTRLITSYLLTPVRGHLRFDPARFRQMFAFSKWTNAYGVLDFLLETFDNTVVARAVGTTALGFYRMAYQLGTEGSSAIQWIVTSVAFPAVARIQVDAEHVRESFRGLLGLVSAALLPATALLVILGADAVSVLLGDRWAPAGVPLRILAGAALVRGILEVGRPVLLGTGRSREDFGLKATQVILMVALVYPAGVAAGMEGVAWAVFAAAALTLPIWAVVIARTIGSAPRDFIAPLVGPAVATIAAVAVIAVIPTPSPSWVRLVIDGSLFAIVYVGLSIILYRVLPGSGLAAARRAAR